MAGLSLLHNLAAKEVNSEIGPPRTEPDFPLAKIQLVKSYKHNV